MRTARSRKCSEISIPSMGFFVSVRGLLGEFLDGVFCGCIVEVLLWFMQNCARLRGRVSLSEENLQWGVLYGIAPSFCSKCAV